MLIPPPTSSLQLVIPSFLLEKDDGEKKNVAKQQKDHAPLIIDTKYMKVINKSAEPLKSVVSSQTEFLKVKEDLHEQSVKRYKQWDNTVLGERRKKIQAANDKARIQEEQRKKIDDAWAIIKQEEHRQALERAVNLQWNADPKVRELNSKLLLMKVIEEREKQIEYKKKRQEIRAHREKQAEQNPDKSTFTHLMDQGKNWQNTRLKAMEIVREQRKVVSELEKEKTERKVIEATHERLELERQRRDIDFAKREAAELKIRKIHEFTKNLQATLEEKEKTKAEMKEMEEQLDSMNRDFLHYKQLLEQKKKEVEKDMLSEKQALSEKTSVIQYSLNQKKEKKLQDYMDKLATYTAFDLESKAEKAKIKRKEALQEQNKYRLYKISVKADEEKQRQAIKDQEKLRVEQAAQAESISKIEKERKFKDTEVEMAQFRSQQKGEFQQRKEKEKEEALQFAKFLKNNSEQDSKKFEEHMSNVIQSLGMKDKKHLIVHDLKTFKGNEKKKVITLPWEESADTFSRLGFIPY